MPAAVIWPDHRLLRLTSLECRPLGPDVRGLRHRNAAALFANLGTRPRRGVVAVASGEAGLSPAETERRIRTACNLISTSQKLLPYDAGAVNLALVIWQAIRDVPPQERVNIVPRLSSADIRRLWKVAGQRYSAPAGAIMAALGPEYSVWKDLPVHAGEVVYHSGRAALPLHSLGISSFTKAFFQRAEGQSGQGRGAGDELFGRVIHPTPLGNWVYPGPMYFRCCVGTTIVPILGEVCDMVITYEEPGELHLADEDIPHTSWPRPRRQRRPFDAGYTDYVRAAGPSVFVGMGYRTAAGGSGVPLVPSPLHFAMVKERCEGLS